MTAEEWISRLELEPHPEGGFYKEVYRNPATIQVLESGGKRNLATSIYFLLKEGQKSHFHQLTSDELWYFHSGTTAIIHIFEENDYRKELLGDDPGNGESLQVIIKAGAIFAAEVSGDYVLMGCMVNPGFDFKDFRMLNASELMKEFPEHEHLIEKFTLE